MKVRAMIATGATVLLFVGCGGGDDPASSDSTGAAAATGSELTKAEFVEQANAVCKQGEEEIKREAQDFISEQGLSEGAVRTRPRQEEIVTKFVIPSIQTQAEELAKLEIPEGDEKEVAAIVFNLGKLAKAAEQNPGSALQEKSGNPLAEVNKAAETYGVEECTQP